MRANRRRSTVSSEQLVYDGLQACPYLEGQVARMPLYRQRTRLSPEETDARLANAERRVGFSLYRTDCPTCRACVGLRIVAGDLKATKSQRRVLKRWQALGDRLEIRVGRATWSEEKLELYNRHKVERGLGSEEDEPMEARGYVGWLIHSCMQTVEMTYHIDGKLVAVGILDVGRDSTSSVYFYFDPSPEIAALSPGTFSVFQEARFCARSGRRYHYLGLWVRDCPSLAYKANFYPHERLVDGDWRLIDGPSKSDHAIQSAPHVPDVGKEERSQNVAVEDVGEGREDE